MVRGLTRVWADGGVRYFFLWRVWTAVSTVIFIYLAATHLAADEQGYYYAFLNIGTWQVFAELGFNAVLIRFISHEWAYLRIDGGAVAGDPEAKRRLASMMRFAVRWTLVAALAVTLLLGAGGYAFLQHAHPGSRVAWRTPWLLSSLGLGLGIVAQVLRTVTEARDEVGLSQKVGLAASILASIAAWGGILGGWGLLMVGVMQGLGGAVTILMLLRSNWPLLRLIGVPLGDGALDWRVPFRRQQALAAITWLCGFAAYQSFIPFIFYFRSPEEAGRFGVLLQAYGLATALAAAWLTSAAPKIGQMWARRDVSALRQEVRSLTRRATATAAGAAAAALIALLAVQLWLPAFSGRLPDIWTAGVFLSVAVAKQGMAIETATIRLGKQEPFLNNSLFAAFYMIVSNLILVRYGLLPMALGYWMGIVLILTPWASRIYHSRMMASAGDG